MEKDNKSLTAEELDALHDSGADMTGHLDLSTGRRPGLKTQRINVDFPNWMVASLDREAERLGVTRQSVIKIWIASHFEGRASPLHPTTADRYSEIRKFIEHEMSVAETAARYGASLTGLKTAKAKAVKSKTPPQG